MLDSAARARLSFGWAAIRPRWRPLGAKQHFVDDVVWYAAIALMIAYIGVRLVRFAAPALVWADVVGVARGGGLTLLRVITLIAIATVIWVPLGVAIGLRPRLAEKVQPLAQFLAAFPANLIFPVAVSLIVHFRLTPGSG